MPIARLSPERVNPYAHGNLLADTDATASHSLFQAIPFLFFSSVNRQRFLVCTNSKIRSCSRSFRWPYSHFGYPGVASAGHGVALRRDGNFSGVGNDPVPTAPSTHRIFLHCGWGLLCKPRRLEADIRAGDTFHFACMPIWAGGLTVYTAPVLVVTAGMEGRQRYLTKKAPEFQVSQAINTVVGSTPITGKTLVLLRHLYYLRVPYLREEVRWRISRACVW
jgi:hypothetical protein